MPQKKADDAGSDERKNQRDFGYSFYFLTVVLIAFHFCTLSGSRPG